MLLSRARSMCITTDTCFLAFALLILNRDGPWAFNSRYSLTKRVPWERGRNLQEGDGTLAHLDARVHLNEVVTPFGVNKELDSARILIVRARHQLERVLMQFLAELRVKRPSWRNLNNLLVATLHRAVALPQVNSVALTVADDLR
eukprot:scaffold43941_cov33-Tisochrysis_lutea.AAC.2